MIDLKHIVVATDFGEAARAAFDYGRDFARAFGATLHLVHVVDDLSATPAMTESLPVDYVRMQMELERDELAALKALLTEDDRRLDVKPVLIRSHAPAAAILEFAKQVRADLVIIGTHGRSGIADFFLGSVAQKVVRSAGCPVLTVRHPEREFLQTDALVSVAEELSPKRTLTPAS